MERRQFLGAAAAAAVLPAGASRPATQPADSLTEHERFILELMDDAGLRAMAPSSIAVSTELTADEATAAMEKLEQRGILRSRPVCYERVGE